MVFDNVKFNESEIRLFLCQSELQKILTINLEQFRLGAILKTYGTYFFDNVFPITLNCSFDEKENITITAIELLNNVAEVGSIYAYQLDVYTVPEFMTQQEDGCMFRKRNDEPLYMICTPNEEGDIRRDFSQGLYLDKIHYKFNIEMRPIQNDEVVHVAG